MDEVIEVKVAKVHEDAQLPTRGSAHAAGYDLYALEDTDVLYRTATLVRTGLHVAAANNQYDVVNFFIEQGADVNCKDSFGRTPMREAVENNHSHHGCSTTRRNGRCIVIDLICCYAIHEA